MTNKEVMQMALETAEQIASADYRHWEELASLGEFERWARSRANHIAEALRTALEKPEPAECDGGQCGIGGYCKECPKTQPDVPETAFGETEPVAWMHNFIDDVIIKNRPTDITCNAGRWTALYTAPPQREWEGLTEEDIAKNIYVEGEFMLPYSFASSIEAKLKEKNNG